MKLALVCTLPVLMLLGFTKAGFAADEAEQTYNIDDRLSGPRIYIGVGADNVAERSGFDSSVYGLLEIASGVKDEATGFRWRASIDGSEVGAWGGAGFSIEHVFEEKPFYVEASILAGLYAETGQHDLGHVIEFRSQIAVGYHFENDYDVAIAYSHKSNASIDDDNPGSEAFYLRFGKAF